MSRRNEGYWYGDSQEPGREHCYETELDPCAQLQLDQYRDRQAQQKDIGDHIVDGRKVVERGVRDTSAVERWFTVPGARDG